MTQPNTLRKQKLKLIVQKIKNTIKAQKLKICRLQTIMGRYKKNDFNNETF